jgi:chorismate synthase
MKYGFSNLRPVIERASARETAARVLAGAVGQLLLKELGIETFSRVMAIGTAVDNSAYTNWDQEVLDNSPLRVLGDPKPMMEEIDKAKASGDSLGGVVEIKVTGLIPGLGSYVHWDKRLDGQLAGAVMSVPAIKGVEIGSGFDLAKLSGSKAHDEIGYNDSYYRYTNRAGGIEGGISTGEDIIVRAAMKPIPTLYKPLKTVELHTHKEAEASVERSDTCAVSAAAIVVEAMVAWIVAQNVLEKFGNDSLADLKNNVAKYLARLEEI